MILIAISFQPFPYIFIIAFEIARFKDVGK